MRRPGEYARVLRCWLQSDVARYGPMALAVRKARTRTRPLPSAPLLEKILDTLFFASMNHEEGRTLRFSVVFAYRRHALDDPGHAAFVDLEELSVRTLRKLTPAFDPWNAAVLVSEREGSPVIWGSMRLPFSGELNHSSFTAKFLIRVLAPGTLEVRHGLSSIATFADGEMHVSRHALDPFTAIAKFLETDAQSPLNTFIVRTIRTVQRLGHGGTLLVVPNGVDPPDLDETRRFQRADCTLADAQRSVELASRAVAFSTTSAEPDATEVIDAVSNQYGAAANLTRAIEYVAQLSAVDGAVVMNRDQHVRSFAAFFRRSDRDPTRIIRVDSDRAKSEITLAQAGGSRHQSACRWVAANPTAGVAFVVSQDGDASIIVGTLANEAIVIGPLTLSADPSEF